MRALFGLLLLVSPAVAQTPPACAPAREGMVACFGEKLCECRWEPGGQLTGRPAGHRWDCGVLRPSCGVAPAGPPGMSEMPITVAPFIQPQPRHDMPDPRLPFPRSGAGAAPYGTR